MTAYRVGMIIDTSAVARRADPERVRDWLAEQRVFISSAMGDTTAERRTVAAAVEAEGARAVWFEEFGRDADAQEAYVTQVDAATVYVAILKEQYGRLNPPDGFSATEAEYLRAREGGKRLQVLTAADAPGREGHLARFIDRVRFNYVDADDLTRRVRRRLHELAAEALSPWVKLGDFVFRAEHITEDGNTVTVRTRVSEEISFQLEALRDQRHARRRLRFVHRSRVVDAELTEVRRTTSAGGVDELTLELAQPRPPAANTMRAGTGGYTPDDLVELGLRGLLFGEALPTSLTQLGFMTDPGLDGVDLRHAFEQPNEIAGAITRVVLADGLVGSGLASRLLAVHLGPRTGDVRRLELSWEEPRAYVNVEPRRRRLEGEWRPV